MALTATITGTVVDINSNPVPNAIVTVALWNYGNNTPTVSGGSIIVTPVITTVANGSGVFSTVVYGNDVISPLGTVYTVTFANANNITISTATYTFNSNNTYNLGTYAPNVTYPLPVVMGPVNATQLQGITLSKTPPTDGFYLKYIAANSDAEWAAVVAGVTSVFGRTGAVVAASNDYSFSQISGIAAAAQYVTMVGDAGAGGIKGAVPAPAAGDATAGKFLKADGTWAATPGLVTSVFGRTGAVISVANDYSFSQLSGSASKSQLPGTAVYTDQANTFGTFLQKFKAGSNFSLTDTSDATKIAQFGLANITTATTRTVNIPDANSTTVQASSAAAHQFATALSAQGIITWAQPALSDLSDTPAANLVIASPNGSSGALSARALVAADLPAPTAIVGNDGFFAPLDVMVIPSPASDSATGNQFTANNVVWVRQFTLSRAHVVGNLVVTVTAAVAASTFDVGIFDVSKNKLLSLGGIAGTATGNKTATFTQITLPAGTYYLAWTATATTGVASLSLREVLMNSDLQTGTTTLMINVNGARFGTAANAGAAGVLPASLGVITKNNSTAAYAPIMFCEP